MPTVTATFPPKLEAVTAARRFLQSTLGSWDAGDYDFGAPLVLTELVTNAALHARTPFEVRLTLHPSHLVIEVADHNPRRPQVRGYDVEATTGRGIGLVSTLCQDWGVTPVVGGKVVWGQVQPDAHLHLMVDLPSDDADDGAAPAAPAPPAQRSGGTTGRDHRTPSALLLAA